MNESTDRLLRNIIRLGFAFAIGFFLLLLKMCYFSVPDVRKQSVYVGITETDTFSTARGWRMDTFISYNSFTKQLDTQYYFKSKSHGQ